MKKLLLIYFMCLFLGGCLGQQKLPKPPTITEQVISTVKVEQKPLYASIMETKGLPNVFILMIVGGVFVLIFLGKSDLGIKLGMALVGAGTTGIVAASTYQRHAETLANWSIVIVISILCFGTLIAAAIFYTKYIRANKAFKEVVESAVPAFEALKEKIGSEKTKASVWATQSDATIAKVEEVKKELLTENTKPQI
jgi:uncharacterized membrane protein